ncbi:MAG TPA: TrkH family potassium uptake protein [Egibacteraceae bacterium]|nr:TrkH family potassium uptake protein [Egibacteraceae bacterium]
MSVSRFVRPLPLTHLSHHAGTLLVLLGGTLVVPAAVALLLADGVQAGVFTGVAAGTAALGWLLRRAPRRALGLREAMALTAAAYVLFALAGATAFLRVAGPTDAFFEAMSGFTTTGLTVMDVEALPRSLLFFRGYSQWLGGAGIIVLSLVVLAGPGSAGAKLYAAEFGQQNLMGNVVATGRIVIGIYAAVTAAGIVALWAAGAGAFDGLVHGLSLASTGGFTPFPDSFAAYDAAPVAAAAGVFMAIGATSLPLAVIVWRRGWRRLTDDAQLRTLVVLIAVGTAALALFGAGPDQGLAAGAFHATSAVTTTGFQISDPAEWTDGARLTTAGLMIVGGSLGSTAGGIKLLRLVIILRVVSWAVSRALLPAQAAIPVKVQHATVDESEVRHTFALVAAYFLLLFTCAVALSAAGAQFEDAVFEVISGLSTVGLSVGVTSPDLPAWAKLLLAFTMWVGRIEILAALVLLHPRNWLRG